MRHPVLLVLARAVLLILLPALALPLLAATVATAETDRGARPLSVALLSATPTGEAAGDAQPVPGHTSARQVPTERVTGAAPPSPDEPPLWRAVVTPPSPAALRPRAVRPDVVPVRTSSTEPTLGRGPPSVTRT